MPGKKGGSGAANPYPSKNYRFPGRQPTPTQLAQKIGKREEDGSFITKGGGAFDPDTGKIRRRKSVRSPVPVKRSRAIPNATPVPKKTQSA